MSQVPGVLMKDLARERVPTLTSAMQTMEFWITAWEVLGSQGERGERIAKFTALGIERASEYYSRLDQSTAYIIAMCE